MVAPVKVLFCWVGSVVIRFQVVYIKGTVLQGDAIRAAVFKGRQLDREELISLCQDINQIDALQY